MRRSFTNSAAIAIFILLAVGLVGCDSSPNSVEDFDIQGTMDSPFGITVTPNISPEFSVSYQGLEGTPTASFASSAGSFNIEQDTVMGDPVQGGTIRWTVSLTAEQIDEVITTEDLVIQGTDQSSGRTITDTIATVVTTKLYASTSFTSNFVTFADYEGDIDSTTYGSNIPPSSTAERYAGNQRTFQTSGASIQMNAGSGNMPAGSNGRNSMQIANSSAGGSVTIRRRSNLPDSDAFFMLVEPPSQPATLTLEFTEITDNSDGGDGNASTTTHSFSFPLTPGTGWLKLGIPFSEIGSDFNPVSPRSGGNGPLVSITLSVDAPVSYAVDELLFGTFGSEGQPLPRAEFHDFERTTLAYGPPFCGGTYDFLDDVAPGSDGYSSRGVNGANCLGYNAALYVDADENDVLSFYGKGIGEEASVHPFIEIQDGSGGFGFSSGVDKTLPADTWTKFEIPLDQMGSDPSVMLDSGISNIGFAGCSSCAIDDIKIVPKE